MQMVILPPHCTHTRRIPHHERILTKSLGTYYDNSGDMTAYVTTQPFAYVYPASERGKSSSEVFLPAWLTDEPIPADDKYLRARSLVFRSPPAAMLSSFIISSSRP